MRKMTWFDSLQVNSVYLLSSEDNDLRSNVSHAEPPQPPGGTSVLIIVDFASRCRKGSTICSVAKLPRGISGQEVELAPPAALRCSGSDAQHAVRFLELVPSWLLWFLTHPGTHQTPVLSSTVCIFTGFYTMWKPPTGARQSAQDTTLTLMMAMNPINPGVSSAE